LQEIADAAAFNAAREQAEADEAEKARKEAAEKAAKEKAEADEAERHAEAAAFNAAREQAEAEKARKESAEKAAKEKAEAAAAAAKASADAIEAARAEAEAEAEALKSPVPAPATAADGEPQPRGSPEWCKWFKDNKGAGPEPDMNKEMDKWVQWLTDNEQVDREVKKAKREFEESGGAVGACPGVDLAENKGSLYVCGGIQGGEITNQFLEYNTTTGYEAKPLAPTKRPRYVGGAVMFKTKIYVVGGAAERGKAGKTKLPSNLHRTIEAFDIESGTWSDVAEIPEQHGGVAWPAVVGDPSTEKIYIIGGMTAAANDPTGMVTAVCNKVSILDTKTMEWTTGRSMLGGRAVAAAALMDDPMMGKKIYLAGGAEPTPSRALSVYDIATDQWEQKASLPTSRVQHKMVAAGGKLWLFSGKTDGDKYCEDMLYYDPLDDEWVSHAGLQPPRLHIGCAFMGKHIFVFGGEDQRVGDQDPPASKLVNKLNLTTSPPSWEPTEELPVALQAMMVCCASQE